MPELQDDFLDAETHNGVTFTRLRHIPYVAVVTHVEEGDSLDGLAIWEDREELGLRGVVTGYPASPEEMDEIAQGVLADSRDENGEYEPFLGSDHDSAKALFSFVNTWRENPEKRSFETQGNAVDHMSLPVQTCAENLMNKFLNTAKADLNSGLPNEGFLEFFVNSDFPQKPHDHSNSNESDKQSDALTISFSGKGTKIFSDDLKYSYQVPAGQVALFDKTLWHGAAQYDESWEESPRTTMTIS